MDGWTGVRSQLTCVILESQKTTQHLLTVHTHNLSLPLSHIHKTPLPLYEGAKRKSAGLFRQASRNTRKKKPSINLSGFWGWFSSVQLSCLVPLFRAWIRISCLSIFLMWVSVSFDWKWVESSIAKRQTPNAAWPAPRYRLVQPHTIFSRPHCSLPPSRHLSPYKSETHTHTHKTSFKRKWGLNHSWHHSCRPPTPTAPKWAWPVLFRSTWYCFWRTQLQRGQWQTRDRLDCPFRFQKRRAKRAHNDACCCVCA